MDDFKNGCEFGRLIESRVKTLEATCAKVEKEMRDTRKEILERLESWWPKPLAILLSGLFGIICALITAIAMLSRG